MSKMLEQAIADAAALREQAIKSAEQSVIDKYSQQIKEAVDKMLEVDHPLSRANQMLEEAEEELNEEVETMPSSFGGGQDGATIEAPPAWDSRYDDIAVRFNAMVDSLPEISDGVVELDLEDLTLSPDEEEAIDMKSDDSEKSTDTSGDLLTEPGSDDAAEGGDDLDSLLNALQENLREKEDSEEEQLEEILKMLESSTLEEEMHIDDGKDIYKPTGIAGPMNPEAKRRMELSKAREAQFGEEEESSEEESSSDDETSSNDKTLELYETIETLAQQNDKMSNVLEKLETHLDEALLANAKLLYQNRTLGDASLNERQKSKIVEAIANAESPKEAKQLFETLKATVGSTPNSKKGPQSLSESVNRKSNLSAMLNTRQNINENQAPADPFLEKMQKLAGIKK